MTRRDLFLQTPLALLVLSCARPSAEVLRPLLNSERIELVFGNYGLEVLEGGPQLRISNLYSKEGEQRICRTFALTFFPPATPPLLAEEDRAIRAGGSIGAVFKKAGFTVEKRPRYFGELAADRGRRRLAGLMGESARKPLALYVYTMVLRRGGESFTYATLAEVYHPAFLDLGDLRAIYGSEVAAHSRPDPEVSDLLARVESATRAD